MYIQDFSVLQKKHYYNNVIFYFLHLEKDCCNKRFFKCTFPLYCLFSFDFEVKYDLNILLAVNFTP